MNLITDSNGLYCATFTTQKGTEGNVCLGTSDEASAKKLSEDIHVEELETVSGIVDLTHQVVTQIVAGKNLTVADTIDLWLKHLKDSRILSTTTVYANHGFVLSWAKEMGVDAKPLSSVEPKHVSDYVNKGGECRSTSVRKLSAIRGFFLFCQEAGYTYRNPAGKSLTRVGYDVFKHEELETKVRQVFTEDDINKLLSNANDFWNAAIILGRDTGLRLGDIACLEWTSVNFDEQKLTVWTDKSNRRVVLPTTPAVFSALRALSTTGITHVFPDQKIVAEDPKRRSLLSVQFSRLCAKSGVTGRSFHCLRHTNATNQVAGGSTLEQVAARLGHGSTNVTALYVH